MSEVWEGFLAGVAFFVALFVIISVLIAQAFLHEECDGEEEEYW